MCSKQMPPDVQKQMLEAAKPQTITAEVISIKTQSVPATAFSAPAGYTKAAQ
jgi:hypothetical protein